MKYLAALLLLSFQFFTLNTKAQDPAPSPVTDWVFVQQSKTGDQYLIQATAKIKKGWKVFSSSMTDDQPNLRINLDSSSIALAKVKNISEKNTLKVKERAGCHDGVEYK